MGWYYWDVSFFSLLPDYHNENTFPPPCCPIMLFLPCHSLKTIQPANHRLKLLNSWAKINPFFLNLFISGILLQQQKANTKWFLCTVTMEDHWFFIEFLFYSVIKFFVSLLSKAFFFFLQVVPVYKLYSVISLTCIPLSPFRIEMWNLLYILLKIPKRGPLIKICPFE